MIILYIAYILIYIVAVTVQDDKPETYILYKSNGIFSARYYTAINRKKGNLLICPLGVNYVLTVLSLGANGKTLDELRKVLNIPEYDKGIIRSYKSLINSLQHKGLEISTKIFVDHSFNVNPDFRQNVEDFFGIEVEKITLEDNREGSKSKINEFFHIQSREDVPTLLKKGSIKKHTGYVIANVVHFETKWKYFFDKLETRKKPFYGRTKEYSVDMMYLKATPLMYAYDYELDSELLELPCQPEYSFLIILPKDKKKGINNVQKVIGLRTAENPDSSPLTDIFNKTTKTTISVYLPQFKFEATNKLRSALRKMGVKKVHLSSANLKGLSNDKKVHLKDIIVKTSINVGDHKNEANADTALLGDRKGKRSVESEFIANKRFIYVIRHNPSGIPFFVGRYVGPKGTITAQNSTY